MKNRREDDIIKVQKDARKGEIKMTITVTSVPETIAEFSALSQNDLSIPENTCLMFLLALKLWLKDKNAGAEAINRLRGPRPMNGFDVSFINDRLRGKEYLPLAYFDGATPDNRYTPSIPLTLEVLSDPRPQDVEEGYIRAFLKTAGADSPRPIKLRRKGDAWYLWEYSSVLTGIRVPKEEDPWA